MHDYDMLKLPAAAIIVPEPPVVHDEARTLRLLNGLGALPLASLPLMRMVGHHPLTARHVVALVRHRFVTTGGHRLVGMVGHHPLTSRHVRPAMGHRLT